ncbi:hypothetical protein TELCIR_17859 [Teladorsagia circumcincta]|uniref:Vps52 C-terminal domain-containing protein n=1 Tax=Teladorsagia circumcincta TaxID=45464 RepID=A0A2G9TTQ2_TELCI|nr:hypothetical protein TELCIR_17859 [Teladorsagia circumcincta]
MSIRKDKSTNSLKAVEDCLAELSTADESIVREALSAGHDLSNFSVQVNEELTEAHRIAVKECIQNADKLTDLHNQILACDQVFERLEKMLLGFQGDLGTISEDMKRLQEQSVSINQIVRRYAELTCAFLVVTESSGRELGKKMEAILESCEDAVEQLLLRMSSCLPNPRDRLVFLINNYDLTLGIIDARDWLLKYSQSEKFWPTNKLDRENCVKIL